MLDCDQLDRGQVEHLPDLLTDQRCPAEVTTAGPARPRDVDDDLVRVRSRLQPEPLIALLLARFAARRAAQRPRWRLDERIRAWRLRRVLRVLPQPGLQLRYPDGQRGDQPVPLDKRYVTLGEHQLQPHDLLSQFLIRHGHPTSITSHTTRSTRRAAQAPE